jgi:exodeoxyribonuclease-3
MKIVTWNVNGIRARLVRVLDWIKRNQPDLLCMQETKASDEEFPWREIETLGYRVEAYGQKGFNGVALVSREPLAEVTRGFDGDPDPAQKRVLAATFRDLRVVTAYVPNGTELGSEKFAHKLLWMDRFRAHLDAAYRPTDRLLVLGDLNVAPEDRDVHDPARWAGKLLCTDSEREKFGALLAWGLRDGLRTLTEEGGIYTWWDYRLMAFQRGWGLRIDHALVTPAVTLRSFTVDLEERRKPRQGEIPSDHAPVVLEIA